MAQPTAGLPYEDFEPYCRWKREEGHDTLEVHLHGFKKEQLRIQLNSLGVVVITGERPVGETKRIRFCKEIKVSKDCNTNEVHAKMSAGILNIIMPKKAQPIPSHQHQPAPIIPPQKNQENDKMMNAKSHPHHNVNKAAQNNELGSGESGINVTTRRPRYRIGSKEIVLNLEMSRKIAIFVAVMLALGAYVAYKWDSPYHLGN